MRAKEYLNQHRHDLKYAEVVGQIIDDLLPLRKDKEATNAYMNRRLSADIRFQHYLLKKELFERGNAMQPEEPVFEDLEGEINKDISIEVRKELFCVIREDDSFGYLFYILGTEYNAHHSGEPIDCVPDSEQILRSIIDNRDDYPKKKLDSFINEDLNYRQYCTLLDGNYWADDDTLYLKYFNRVYQIYDELRLRRGSMSEVKKYLQEQKFDNDAEKFWIYSFIITLIEAPRQKDESLGRCKMQLAREIEPLRERIMSQPTSTGKSPVYLTERTGAKIDIIRVLNVLYEMGTFTGENGKKISKKDFMVAMGQAMNMDLSGYDKDLSRSLSDSTKLEKHLRIFENMLQKMTDIFNMH